MIDGVLTSPLRRISGPAGDVLHAMKRSAEGFSGFGEAYFSTVHQGAIKSWRCHRIVTMNLVVPVGAVRFVVHDARDDSRTRGRFTELAIGVAIDNYARLTIPSGLWLAFQGIGPGTSVILDIIDREHDPAEAEACDLAAIPYAW